MSGRVWVGDTAAPGGRAPRAARVLALAALAIIVLALLPVAAAAHEAGQGRGGHTLEVLLSFPDGGVAEGEQLCLALFPGDTTDFSQPPALARCLDPGEDSVTFEGIGHGRFVVAVPSEGSRLESDRYQGQLVETAIPDEPGLDAFGIEVALDLSPDAAGVTGKVQVNVYGCPAGTDGGGDATVWATECRALADGIPVRLSGVDNGDAAAIEAVTGEEGTISGRVLFTDLPAGAYQLAGTLPTNVRSPAVFIQSSVEGGVRPLDQSGTVDVRPAEVVAVDVYLVLDSAAEAAAVDAATATPETTVLGFDALPVTGGLTAEEAKAMEAARGGGEPRN